MGAKLYNVLENPDLQFALLHRLGRGEYTTRVKGGKKRKIDDLGIIAGDGRYGFPSRPKKNDEVSFVETIRKDENDEKGLKKSRYTATRPRKMPCRMPTTQEVRLASMDPIVRAEKEKRDKQVIRARNRNRKARYGRRCAKVVVSAPSSGKRGGLEATKR